MENLKFQLFPEFERLETGGWGENGVTKWKGKKVNLFLEKVEADWRGCVREIGYNIGDVGELE